MNSVPSMKTKQYLPTLLFFIVMQMCFIQVNAQIADTIDVIDKDPEKILRKVDLKSITRNGINFWQDEFAGHWAGVDFGFNMFVNEDYSGYDSEFMENDVFRSNTTYINFIQQSIGFQKARNTIGMDFGFNMFVNEDYSGYDSEFMENDVFRSNTTYINFIQQSIGFQKARNTIGMVTGLGLHLQSYRLDDNTTIYKDGNGVIHPEELYFDNNQKSKLSLVSLAVPLLVEFQIPVNHFDNRMYVSAGLVGSVRLHSHTKIKYKAERREKLKVVEDFSIHRFNYSVMVKAGSRWLNVFATCDLVPLFKADKGPEITPFSFGVTLLSF